MSFGAQISQFTQSAEKKLTNAYRKTGLEIFSRVIQRTPVDTGRARGNWQAAVGEIPGGQLDELDPSGAEATNRAAGVALNAELGDTLYLSNNLPYIRELEYGSSQQAPQGMVRVTTQEFADIVVKATDNA